MIGILLGNISEQDDLSSECCKKKLLVNKKTVALSIISLYDKITFLRMSYVVSF